MLYSFCAKKLNSIGDLVVLSFEGRLFSDALFRFWEFCESNFEQAIFFEIKDAGKYNLCLDDVVNDYHYHSVKTKVGTFYVYLDSVQIVDPKRNFYLLELRAKREFLGISCEKMGELTGQADYKDRELGHRKMTIDDFARYMLILNDIENGV